MKTLLATLALSLSLATAAEDRGYPRVALTPMLGIVHGVPGFGADLSFGLGPVALGARAVAGNSLCVMCLDAEGETQLSLLGGWRREFRTVTVGLRSGITYVERHSSTYDRWIEDYRYRDFDGYGVPVTVDVAWSNRFIGGNLSGTTLIDRDGGSFALMVGMPLGYLRH